MQITVEIGWKVWYNKMVIEANGLHFSALNEKIRQAGSKCCITGCLGQRFIAAGMQGKNITIEGIPGNALGAYFGGGRIDVIGNAQDAVGDTMNDGEIIVRGEHVMKGYYKNPEATAQVIDKDGWLHTGDLGVMDAAGNITIKGRSKNMLLGPSGQNIYPEEIESKLNNMPYVAESLIVLQHEKLVAMIYPDFDDAFAHGLQQTDIQKVMEQNRIELNQQLPNYSQISKIKIHFEEFEKTAKKSIKRFMYQEAKG